MRLYFAFTRADRGISLIELMIIVVLISTIATAYWNFHIMRGGGVLEGPTAIVPDSAVTSALDEICGYLLQARPDTSGEMFKIEHQGDTDRIRIIHDRIVYDYYVDGRSNLVRRVNSDSRMLAGDVISLKAFRMGAQTLVVTLSVLDDDSSRFDDSPKSYSRVITTDALSTAFSGL